MTTQKKSPETSSTPAAISNTNTHRVEMAMRPLISISSPKHETEQGNPPLITRSTDSQNIRLGVGQRRRTHREQTTSYNRPAVANVRELHHECRIALSIVPVREYSSRNQRPKVEADM